MTTLNTLTTLKDEQSAIIFKLHGFMPSERKYLKSDEAKKAWDTYHECLNEIAKLGSLKFTNPTK